MEIYPIIFSCQFWCIAAIVKTNFVFLPGGIGKGRPRRYVANYFRSCKNAFYSSVPTQTTSSLLWINLGWCTITMIFYNYESTGLAAHTSSQCTQAFEFHLVCSDSYIYLSVHEVWHFWLYQFHLVVHLSFLCLHFLKSLVSKSPREHLYYLYHFGWELQCKYLKNG